MNNGGSGTTGLDYVSNLTDEDLYQKLKDLGDSVGPIVGTTRSLYERRLYNLLNGVMMGLNHTEQQTIIEPPSKPRRTTNVVVDNETHSENEGTKLKQRTTQQSSSTSSMKAQHHLSSSSSSNEEEERELSTLEYPEYETPPLSSSSYVATPRRGFYSNTEAPNSTPSSYMSQLQSGSLAYHRSGTVLNNNFNLNSSRKIDESSNKKNLKKTHPLVTIVFEIFIICFLLVVGYIFYQEIIMYSKAEKEFVESNGQNFPKE